MVIFHQHFMVIYEKFPDLKLPAPFRMAIAPCVCSVFQLQTRRGSMTKFPPLFYSVSQLQARDKGIWLKKKNPSSKKKPHTTKGALSEQIPIPVSKLRSFSTHRKPPLHLKKEKERV
uniref:Uncharacterized protein n=1 Tax=Opuntia streptacantha TaxID=393608 RepID=A0A7C9D7B5_OPUST